MGWPVVTRSDVPIPGAATIGADRRRNQNRGRRVPAPLNTQQGRGTRVTRLRAREVDPRASPCSPLLCAVKTTSPHPWARHALSRGTAMSQETCDRGSPHELFSIRNQSVQETGLTGFADVLGFKLRVSVRLVNSSSRSLSGP